MLSVHIYAKSAFCKYKSGKFLLLVTKFLSKQTFMSRKQTRKIKMSLYQTETSLYIKQHKNQGILSNIQVEYWVLR